MIKNATNLMDSKTYTIINPTELYHISRLFKRVNDDGTTYARSNESRTVTVSYRKRTDDFSIHETLRGYIYHDSTLRFVTKKDAENFISKYLDKGNPPTEIVKIGKSEIRPIVAINCNECTDIPLYVSQTYVERNVPNVQFLGGASDEDVLTHIDTYTVSQRRKLADSTTASAKILDYLSDDEDYNVRRLVASNKNTQPSVLDKLATDPVHHVKFSVIHNPNTSISTFKKLAKDSDKWVRRNLTLYRNTPPQILAMLCNDLEELVVEPITRNSNATAEIKKQAQDNLDRIHNAKDNELTTL